MNSNLIQFNEMPPELHRELSAKGGRASGESKRRKIKMRESLMKSMEYYDMRDDLRDELTQAIQVIRKRERRRQKDRECKQKKREDTVGEPPEKSEI